MKKRGRTGLRITGLTLLFIALFLALNLFICNGFMGPIDEPLPMRMFSDDHAFSAAPDTSAHSGQAPAKQIKKQAAPATAQQPLAPLPPPPADSTATTSGPNLDKKPPFVWANPGPGIHDKPIAITLQADEPADIAYMANESGNWTPYSTPLPVADSLHLTFKGTDRAGNCSDPVVRIYIIRARKTQRCPEAMVAVETKAKAFCIDQFEWPNRKGVFPLGFINWYMASDSCRASGKRLCTAAEWEEACAGNNNTRYPYGNAYEPRTCNTEEDKAYPAGAFSECRSYAGAYDMSGNLREWTASRSGQNPRYYEVYGGFWENRGATTCRSAQYSFYPQNKFISIGFRCCDDTLQQ